MNHATKPRSDNLDNLNAHAYMTRARGAATGTLWLSRLSRFAVAGGAQS
jgi:hypothetical protein